MVRDLRNRKPPSDGKYIPFVQRPLTSSWFSVNEGPCTWLDTAKVLLSCLNPNERTTSANRHSRCATKECSVSVFSRVSIRSALGSDSACSGAPTHTAELHLTTRPHALPPCPAALLLQGHTGKYPELTPTPEQRSLMLTARSQAQSSNKPTERGPALHRPMRSEFVGAAQAPE